MIITLPMTPRKMATVGYWASPLVGDILSKRINDRFYVAIGKLGKRDTDDSMINDFIKDLNTIGVNADNWIDSDNLMSLIDSTHQLLKDSKTVEGIDRYYVCRCGVVEIKVDHVNSLNLKQKAFKVVNGHEVICLRCESSSAIKLLNNCTFYFRSENIETVLNCGLSIYPKFYYSELNDLLGQINEHGIQISKFRDTGFQYLNYNIDLEFIWQNMLTLFPREEKIVLSINNHVLRQTLISVLIFREAGFNTPIEIVVSPYFSYPGSIEKWEINKLIGLGFDREMIRYLVASSFIWQSKNVVLDPSIAQVEHRRFNLFKKIVLENSATITDRQCGNIIKDINRHNLSLGLKHVFNPEKFDYSKLKGLF